MFTLFLFYRGDYSTVNFEKQGESGNINKVLFYFYFCYDIFIIKK